MRVLRGRADTPERDRAVTAAMLDRAGATGGTAVRVWRPPRQVAFGRRDATAEGYDRARRVAEARGFVPLERDVGGRAVPYTGETVAFARAEPAGAPVGAGSPGCGGTGDETVTARGTTPPDGTTPAAGDGTLLDGRAGIDERYERAAADLRRALARLGVDAEPGEPPEAFCPGSHSLRREGKLAGLAQRVRGDAALVAGVLVVDGREFAAVTGAVYAALGVPFDPGSVEGLRRAGVRDTGAVLDVLAEELAGDGPVAVEQVG